MRASDNAKASIRSSSLPAMRTFDNTVELTRSRSFKENIKSLKTVPAFPSPQFPQGPYAAVPNLITCMVIASGCALMLASSLPNFHPGYALVAVVTGLIADILDGVAARKLDAKSQFGSAFDQLADLTCFGIGPAVFFVRAILDGQPGFSMYELVCLFSGFCYMACSAARIARELVVTNMSRPLFFVGIPTNLACPILVLSTVATPHAWWLPCLALFLSCMMISNVHIYKDLGIGWCIGCDFLNLRGPQNEQQKGQKSQ